MKMEEFIKKHKKHIHKRKNGNYYHFNPITGCSLEFKEVDMNDKHILHYFNLADEQFEEINEKHKNEL